MRRNRNERNMNKLLTKLTLLIIGVCLTTQIQTTSAGFNDAERAEQNSYQSGSVDLVLTSSILNSIEDTVASGEFRFVNAGTIPFVYDKNYKVTGSSCGGLEIDITLDSNSIYSGLLLGLDGFNYLQTNKVHKDEEDIYILEIRSQTSEAVNLVDCLITLESHAWQADLTESVGFNDHESSTITHLESILGLQTFSINTTDSDEIVDSPILEPTLTSTPFPTQAVRDVCVTDCPVDPLVEVTPTPTMEPTSTPEVTPTPIEPGNNTAT